MIGPVESVENERQLLLGDDIAVVYDLHGDRILIGPEADIYPLSFLAVFDRVVDEIIKKTCKEIGIRFDGLMILAGNELIT